MRARRLAFWLGLLFAATLALAPTLAGCARPSRSKADAGELPYHGVQVMPFVPVIAASGQPGLALAAEAFDAGERVLIIAARFEHLAPGAYRLAAELKDGNRVVTGNEEQWEQQERAPVVIHTVTLRADLGPRAQYTVVVTLGGRVIAALTIPTR